MENRFLHFHNSLDQQFCIIRYIELNNMLSTIWKGPASEESISHVKQGIMDMVQQFKCNAILNDVQEFFHAATEILAKFTMSEWNNEVEALGVKYIVHVLRPDDELPPNQDTKTGLLIRFFKNKIDAVDWITNQQSSSV